MMWQSRFEDAWRLRRQSLRSGHRVASASDSPSMESYPVWADFGISYRRQKEACMHLFARGALSVILLMIASMAAYAQGSPDRALLLELGLQIRGSGDFLRRVGPAELRRVTDV